MTGDIYELGGLAIPEELVRLHDLLDRMMSEHPDVGHADAWLFETAVIEIADNVVQHGRPQGRVSWHFHMEVRPDRLLATLADSGEEFTGDLTTAMPGGLEEGGRGIPLARASLDELTYERVGGRNHWKMLRLRHPN